MIILALLVLVKKTRKIVTFYQETVPTTENNEILMKYYKMTKLEIKNMYFVISYKSLIKFWFYEQV